MAGEAEEGGGRRRRVVARGRGRGQLRSVESREEESTTHSLRSLSSVLVERELTLLAKLVLEARVVRDGTEGC